MSDQLPFRDGAIVGLGTIVVDEQMHVRRFPESNTKTEATSSRTQVGGPVPTALVLLSRLKHACEFIGTIGPDAAGRLIRSDLLSEGVQQTGLLERTDDATGVAHIWVEEATGDRTIVCRRPQTPLRPDELNVEQLQSASVLHLDGWPGPAALRAARIVHEAGGLVSLDAGTPKEGLSELLPFVHVINCPSRFGEQFLGETDPQRIAQQLQSIGPKVITITKGDEGAWLFAGSEHMFRPAFRIAAKDTTGAGDVFAGGLLHGIRSQWPWSEVLRFASAAAAFKCQHIGNRAALPTLLDVQRMMKQSP